METQMEMSSKVEFSHIINVNSVDESNRVFAHNFLTHESGYIS